MTNATIDNCYIDWVKFVIDVTDAGNFEWPSGLFNEEKRKITLVIYLMESIFVASKIKFKNVGI